MKPLGQGSYGEVFLAKPTADSLDYFAIKVTQLPLHHCSSFSSPLREKCILECFIGCPEIVQCYGGEIIIMEGDSFDLASFFLIMEYAAGGSLADLIKKRKKLAENEVKDYLRMILRGVACIHDKGFVHADLKPGNILAFPQPDGKMKLKITDFGLTRRSCEEEEAYDDYCVERRFRGTPIYMSPESVYGQVKAPLDIWSVGCIAVEIVSGKPVWDGCPDQKLMLKLVDKMEIPKIPEEFSEEGKDFVGRCFDLEPERRWTAEMLLQHPYLKEENKDEIQMRFLHGHVNKFRSAI